VTVVNIYYKFSKKFRYFYISSLLSSAPGGSMPSFDSKEISYIIKDFPSEKVIAGVL